MIVEDDPAIRHVLSELLTGARARRRDGGVRREGRGAARGDLARSRDHRRAHGRDERDRALRADQERPAVRADAGGRADRGRGRRRARGRTRGGRGRLLCQAGGLQRAARAAGRAPPGEGPPRPARARRGGHHDARADHRGARPVHRRATAIGSSRYGVADRRGACKRGRGDDDGAPPGRLPPRPRQDRGARRHPPQAGPARRGGARAASACIPVRARTSSSGSRASRTCGRSSATITSAGTARAIPTDSPARRFRSGRGSSRWWTSTTRCTPERPYKPALSRVEAVRILERETEAGFWDPRVVAAFFDVLRGLEPELALLDPRRSSASPRRRGAARPDAGFSPAAC